MSSSTDIRAELDVPAVVSSEWRRRASSEIERYFALTREMVILAGFDGYWKRVNPTVEAVLGYTEAEALSRPFMELVHPDDRERTEEEARRVIEGATAFSFVNRILCKDGSYKWIEWTATPVPEERVMWCIGRDVTERRHSEGEQTALRRLAKMVAEGVPPSEIFSAVSQEVGRLFGSDLTVISRFDPDGPATIVMGVASDVSGLPVGSRWELEDGLAAGRVFHTGSSARIDAVDWSDLHTPIGAVARRIGVVSTVSCPIHVEGRLWGTISVPAREPLPPDTEERLEKFTQVVATAIANADSRQAVARLADEQAALRRVATLVAQDVPSGELFAAVAREVGELFSTDFSGMGRFEGDALVVVASSDEAILPFGTLWGIDEAGASAEVYRTGRSARIDGVDWSAVEGPIGEVARRSGVASTVASPIIVAGKPWGVLSISSTHDPLPTDTEERLVKFADLVATAIANAESRDALARLANEQAALRRVATLVARDASSDEVFESVATEVGKLFDTDITIVGRYDDDGMATAIGNWSASPGGVPAGTRSAVGGRNLLTMVAETGKPARIDGYDDASGEAAEIARRHGWQSSIAAPIFVEDRLWGVMLVATRRPQPFPAGAEERLAAFTDLVATAVANAQTHDEVRRFGDEQATLRRIATLVAKGVQPEDVFAAVSEEVAATFRAIAAVLRFADDAPEVILAGASKEIDVPIGSHWDIDDALAADQVYRTGRSARVGREQWSSAEGPVGEAIHRLGIVSTVASPIIVEGSLWGVIGVNAREELPPDTEQRLEKFTELVTTAISNAASRVAIGRLADEQAALRRVATLVARDAPSTEVFEAVATEVGKLLDTDITLVGRYDSDGAATAIGSWSASGGGVPVGTRSAIGGHNVLTTVAETGKPARVDGYDDASGEAAEIARRYGIRSAVASPIVVESEPWGAILVGSRSGSLPPGTEGRLEKFTELVATAIANAESKSALNASRRRIVAASDETRRRIERDLHDGTQQRLVSLGLAVRAAEAHLPAEREDLRDELSGVAMGLAAAVEDLQEISRGIHPAILSKGGVGPALHALAHRSPIPVDLDITTDARLAEPIEVAAYFVASEALANAAKHSEASHIDVSLERRDGSLVLSVRDDGVGGADAARGSGIVGLTDRVEAIGGSLRCVSRPGEGTQIEAKLPLELGLVQPA